MVPLVDGMPGPSVANRGRTTLDLPGVPAPLGHPRGPTRRCDYLETGVDVPVDDQYGESESPAPTAVRPVPVVWDPKPSAAAVDGGGQPETTEAPPEANEIAPGAWYVNTPVGRGDIERSAYKAAARVGKGQQVHDHPESGECTEGCHVVAPDTKWPGGSMGGQA